MKTLVAFPLSIFMSLSLPLTNAHASYNIGTDTEAYSWSENEPAPRPVIASHYGPFRVVAHDRAELDGSISTETPQQFRALLNAYPEIRQIDFVECPGTDDDEANLAVARMIRKAGIATYVPSGGSVRSGGVELFLAGARRRADPEAEFAVHSWVDEDGMEPDDFAESDAVNQEYVRYYREMGMSEANARAFYAATNSVPHDDALYLKPVEIAAYLPFD